MTTNNEATIPTQARELAEYAHAQFDKLMYAQRRYASPEKGLVWVSIDYGQKTIDDALAILKKRKLQCEHFPGGKRQTGSTIVFFLQKVA